MINHARTVLLNYKGPHEEDTGVPGDIYIPPFEPVVLTAQLSQVHGLLFGADPDYNGQVYRADQYIGLLHATEYEPHVYINDSRITYDPKGLTVMDEGFFATVVYGGDGLRIANTWPAAGTNGRVRTAWHVRIMSPTTVEVMNVITGQKVVYGTLDVKVLVGSDLVFSLDVQPYVSGTTWYVINTARPKPELGELLVTIKALPGAVLTDIFDNVREEPGKTYYNLFTKHYAAIYQLSGFLFAFIKRLEGIRTHGV